MVSSSISLAAVAAVLAGSVSAHQTVYIPAPTFTTNDKTTKTNPIAFLENQGFKPNDDLTGYLQSKGYKTLRDFMDNKANYKNEAAGATFECGYTDPNGARQPIPANGMMRSSGFIHEGPCEVWIDNTRVLGSSSGNCQKDIPGQPVSYKIDFSVCKGDCLIRWYWLGKRLIGKKWSWQVYKECIPITAGAKRSIDDGDDAYESYSNSTAISAEEQDLESYRMDGNDDEEEKAAAAEEEDVLTSYRMDGNDATDGDELVSYRVYDVEDANEERALAEEEDVLTSTRMDGNDATDGDELVSYRVYDVEDADDEEKEAAAEDEDVLTSYRMDGQDE